MDLKSPHVSCLYYLYNSEGMTATELCEICGEDKAAMSRSIDYLEKIGLVFCASDMKKRYKSILTLTDKGRQIGKVIYDKIDAILARASEGLSEEHRVIMYKSLALISENLQKICNAYDK